MGAEGCFDGLLAAGFDVEGQYGIGMSSMCFVDYVVAY